MPALSDVVAALDPFERPLALAALRGEIARRARLEEAALDRTKRCPSCGEHRTLREWSSNVARKDGLQSRCRPCRRAAG